MKAPFPARAPSPSIVEALARLESSTTFDGLSNSYEEVAREAILRSRAALIVTLASITAFVVLFALARIMGWLPAEWSWLFLLLIVPFTAVLNNTLRGSNTVEAERRMDRALRMWRWHALRESRTNG